MALDLNSLNLFRKHAGGPAGLSTPRAGLAVKAVDACVCVCDLESTDCGS